MNTEYNNRLKIDAVKIKLLTHLADRGATSKTELIQRVRQYIPECRKQALNELIDDSNVVAETIPTIKPGRNPVHLKITSRGRQLLKALRDKHNV